MSTQPTQLSADDQQVKDFAGKIRAKYPGAYDDMPDFQLSKAIATKHPEYADMLPAGFAAKPSPHSPAGADVRAATPTQFEKDRTPGANSGTLQHIGGLLKSVGQGAITQGIKNLSPIGMAETGLDTLKAIRGVPAQYEHERARGINPVSSALSAAAPVVGVPVRPQAMEEAANRGDVGGVTGEMIGGMGLAATPLLAEGAGKLASAGRAKLGSLAFTPEGELKPGLEQFAEHPLKGAIKAGLKAIAQPPEAPGTGAPLPSAGEFYENAGKENVDIMNRTRRQEALDRAAASRAAKNAPKPVDVPGGVGASLPSAAEHYENLGQENVDIIKRTQAQEAADRVAAVRAARNAPKPVDVPGGTGAVFPSAAEHYENVGQENLDIMKRTQAQQAADRVTAARAARNAPKPAPPSFGQGMTSTANPGGANLELPTVPEGPTPEPPARIVTGTEKPQKSLIVRPDEPEPAIRRTMQSQPREVLARLAAKGDPAAIAELRRNPGRVDVDAIPNLRYIGVRPLIQ